MDGNFLKKRSKATKEDKSLGGCRGNRAVGTRLPLAGRPCEAAPRAAPGRLAAEAVPVPFPCGAAESGRRHPSPARPERPLPTGPAQAIKAGCELGFCVADCGAVWTPRGPGSATPGGQRTSVAGRRAFAPRPPVAEAGSEIKARAPGPALLPYRDRKKAECPSAPAG